MKGINIHLDSYNAVNSSNIIPLSGSLASTEYSSHNMKLGSSSPKNIIFNLKVYHYTLHNHLLNIEIYKNFPIKK